MYKTNIGLIIFYDNKIILIKKNYIFKIIFKNLIKKKIIKLKKIKKFLKIIKKINYISDYDSINIYKILNKKIINYFNKKDFLKKEF